MARELRKREPRRLDMVGRGIRPPSQPDQGSRQHLATSFRSAALSCLPCCQRAMLAARPAESGRLLLLASSVIDHAQIGQFWGRTSDLAVWFAAASDQLFCWAFACCGLVVSSAGLGRVADVVEQGAVDLGAVGPGDRVRAARDDGGRAFSSNAGSLLPVASWGRTRS